MGLFRRKHEMHIGVIIDDILQIVPLKAPFSIEPLLEKVLTDRKLFEGQDIFFIAGAAKVEDILTTNDFVFSPYKDAFQLTEKGILAKELGGLTAYRRYRKELLGFNTYQKTINKWLIAATFLAGLSPVIVELTKKYWISNDPVRVEFVNPVHILDTLTVKSDTSLPGQKSRTPLQLSQDTTKPQTTRPVPSRKKI